MFSKFLGVGDKLPADRGEARPAPRRGYSVNGKKLGRPTKPDAELKQPRRNTADRHQPNGRLKRSELKGKHKSGCKHPRVIRANRNRVNRRYRAKTNMAYARAYNATLRRKFIQNRWLAHQAAKRRGLDPAWWYQITYEDWLLLWTTRKDIFHEGSFHKAYALQNNPLKCYNNCTYFDRLDRTKPFTLDNVAIFYRGTVCVN